MFHEIFKGNLLHHPFISSHGLSQTFGVTSNRFYNLVLSLLSSTLAVLEDSWKNVPTWVIIRLEASSSNIEIWLENYQELVSSSDRVGWFICSTVFAEMGVGDCWPIEQGNKVKVTSLVVLKLEVLENQGDNTHVWHMDCPGAVCVVAVLLRVAWTGDNAW